MNQKSEIISPEPFHDLVSNLNGSVPVKINDSTFYIFSSSYDSIVQERPNYQVFYSILRKSEGMPYINAVEYKRPFYGLLVSGLAVVEDTTGGSWLIMRVAGNRFISYYFDGTCFGCRIVQSNLPISFSSDFGVTKADNYLIRSPSGNLLAMVSEEDIKDQFRLKIVELINTIYCLRFDKQSGKVTLMDTVWYSRHTGMDKEDRSFSNYFRVEFSSNDSLLYFTNLDKKLSKAEPYYMNTANLYAVSISKLKQRVLLDQQEKSVNLPFFAGIKLMNNRHLYYFDYDWDKKSISFHEKFDPNKMGDATSIIRNRYTFPKSVFAYGDLLSYSPYNYIITKPIIDYGCDAKATFDNRCDYSLKGTTVEYFVRDVINKDQWVSVGEKPYLEYDNNGDYPFKVILKSNAANYKEEHYDTIKVRIPEKPIADFRAVDTIICRYLPLQFLNNSQAKYTHPTKKQEYLWHFGDGQTSKEFEPKHVYTSPGLYTVSLFYHNGYCDSTLVKNQYIKVTDAPKPGFSIDNNRGCTPFTVNFTDTSFLDVTKKEYYFSDVDLWQTIRNSKFSHTYNQAGIFRAVQRLYGNTGCIIQTDSVFIYATPGLSKADTVHLDVATYKDISHIALTWQPLYGAVKYQVFRGIDKTKFTPIAQSDELKYLDAIDKPSALVYAVAGIDSCGSHSAYGRIGRPILLEGRVNGKNEMGVLKYNPYEEWVDYVITYSIETDNKGTWSNIGNFRNNEDFEDMDFLVEGNTEKCYKITARNRSFVSQSNTICLPYAPLFFIPTAFSPNEDGSNDTYKPVIYGLTDYEIKIYNRWGELIEVLYKGEVWEANEIPTGVYFVQLTGRGTDQIQYHVLQTVTIIR